MSRLSILGVPIDPLTTSQVLDQLDQHLQAGKKTFVATINPEFIMAAQRDDQFLQVLQQADLAVADGIGILWAASFSGYQPKLPTGALRSLEIVTIGIVDVIRTLANRSFRFRVIPEQVTGVDLSQALAAMAAGRGYKMFLLGERPGVASEAATVLSAQNPGLQIVGTFAGDGSPTGDPEVRTQLHQRPAQIVLVAYGAPKQELWIQRNLENIPPTLAIGVGGTFMFLSGRARRAPQWVRNLGLEWLFRLITQPWRWRRQLALIRFVVSVIRYKIHQSS